MFLDILTRLGDFAAFDDLEVQEIEFHGVNVRIASPRTLYWMKKGTLREVDRLDARRLREQFQFEEPEE